MTIASLSNLANTRQLSRRRSARLSRPPRMIRPGAAERAYRKDLLTFVDRIRALVDKILMPALPASLKAAASQRPTADGVRTDAYGDDIRKLMDLLRASYAGMVSDKDLAPIAKRIASQISASNGHEVGKVFQQVLGVDLLASEPWLKGEMDGFVNSNVALIKSIGDKYLSDVETIVYQGARDGTSSSDLAADIRDRFDVTQSRAELIARDQVGKFNGQISQLRQQASGVSRYRWRGALDARERPEHRAREGKVYSWSNPPFDGHPGQPINCRCYAEPVLEDLIDGGDA